MAKLPGLKKLVVRQVSTQRQASACHKKFVLMQTNSDPFSLFAAIRVSYSQPNRKSSNSTIFKPVSQTDQIFFRFVGIIVRTWSAFHILENPEMKAIAKINLFWPFWISLLTTADWFGWHGSWLNLTVLGAIPLLGTIFCYSDKWGHISV